MTQTLNALSPLRVLERGYAVCRNRSGVVVSDAADVELDSPLEVVLHRGELAIRVTEIRSQKED